MKKRNQEAPLPSNVEAELALLGTFIIDENRLDEVLFLKPEDFYDSRNEAIFRAMTAMRVAQTPIDTVTLYDELEKHGKLEEAGGAAYVAKIGDSIPKTENAAQYAKAVYDKSIVRRVIRVTSTAYQVAMSGSLTPEKLVESFLTNAEEIALRRALDIGHDTDYRSASVSLLNKSEETTLFRVNTGIGRLDEETGGFRPGELITLTAGTGVGKTLMAQQTRIFACSQGLHSLYCSAEMMAEQLVARELATDANVPHWKMRQPERLKPEEYTALVHAASHQCERCTILDGELSLRKIWMMAHKKRRYGGLHLLILDYDELISAPGKDELEQQRNLVRGAKALAMSLMVPVIMISQLRKSLDAKEAKKPTLERLYGAGAKSKHSSFVIFIDREYVRELKGDETKARICILKSRDGRVGEFPATFNVNTLRFQEESEEEAYNRAKKKKVAKQEAEQDSA